MVFGAICFKSVILLVSHPTADSFSFPFSFSHLFSSSLPFFSPSFLRVAQVLGSQSRRFCSLPTIRFVPYTFIARTPFIPRQLVSSSAQKVQHKVNYDSQSDEPRPFEWIHTSNNRLKEFRIFRVANRPDPPPPPAHPLDPFAHQNLLQKFRIFRVASRPETPSPFGRGLFGVVGPG